MKTLLLLLLLSLSLIATSSFAHGGALEDNINQKARGAIFCSITNTGAIEIACDGKDVHRGYERFSLAMKLLIETGLRPLSCNYARGDKDLSDVVFCALSK